MEANLMQKNALHKGVDRVEFNLRDTEIHIDTHSVTH